MSRRSNTKRGRGRSSNNNSQETVFSEKKASQVDNNLSVSVSPTKLPQDNYWSYALMLLMKTQMGKIIDDDFQDKLLPILKMTPKDMNRRPRPGDTDMTFSEDTIREFESRYSDIVPLGPSTNMKLSGLMTRCIELYLKLHLKDGVKYAKPRVISAFDAFMMRDVRYKCKEMGVLFYMDKEVLVGKITRVLSVDVVTFKDVFQTEEEGDKRTFHFMLLQLLRNGQFEAEEIYPFGWYASIIRPLDFEKNEGVWGTYSYDLKSGLTDDEESLDSE